MSKKLGTIAQRPKRDLDKSLWRDQEDFELNEDGCPGQKQYCETIDACVDDCNLFQNDETPFVIVCRDGLVSLTQRAPLT